MDLYRQIKLAQSYIPDRPASWYLQALTETEALILDQALLSTFIGRSLFEAAFFHDAMEAVFGRLKSVLMKGGKRRFTLKTLTVLEELLKMDNGGHVRTAVTQSNNRMLILCQLNDFFIYVENGIDHGPLVKGRLGSIFSLVGYAGFRGLAPAPAHLVPTAPIESNLLSDGANKCNLLPDGTTKSNLLSDGATKSSLLPDGAGKVNLMPAGTGKANLTQMPAGMTFNFYVDNSSNNNVQQQQQQPFDARLSANPIQQQLPPPPLQQQQPMAATSGGGWRGLMRFLCGNGGWKVVLGLLLLAIVGGAFIFLLTKLPAVVVALLVICMIVGLFARLLC